MTILFCLFNMIQDFIFTWIALAIYFNIIFSFFSCFKFQQRFFQFFSIFNIYNFCSSICLLIYNIVYSYVLFRFFIDFVRNFQINFVIYDSTFYCWIYFLYTILFKTIYIILHFYPIKEPSYIHSVFFVLHLYFLLFFIFYQFYFSCSI